ncbi:hypothetical protein Cgig2_027958 [Carnegiea gigantea]|uniref:Uncharacterized protein n=1 Tax=Carnegiea gigantea TaxID=171969 RepID=A0A9Q1Q8C2_9CARY|nr:hypothetical protein Cgig2_027958 [Carnegiea gigantea]
MSPMADAITRQVSEQVKRAMEVAGSARPLLSLNTCWLMKGNPLTGQMGCRPFAPRSHEVAQSARSGQPPIGQQGRRAALEPIGRSARGTTTGSTTASAPYSGHSTIECRELKKALHELANKGQIDRFLKRGLWNLVRPRHGMRNVPPEVVATIVGGYVEEITQSAWKAQLRSVQQVLNVEQGSCLTTPMMVFGGKDAP